MKTDIRAAVGATFVEACRVLLPGLAAFALIGAGARAETVDEIIAQNIQARGGLEKLKAIRKIGRAACRERGWIGGRAVGGEGKGGRHGAWASRGAAR